MARQDFAGPWKPFGCRVTTKVRKECANKVGMGLEHGAMEEDDGFGFFVRDVFATVPAAAPGLNFGTVVWPSVVDVSATTARVRVRIDLISWGPSI